MEILYNTKNNTLGNTPVYNGNISATIWKTTPPTGVLSMDSYSQKAYTYSYDNLNRLLTGNYFEVIGNAWINNAKYSENIIDSYNSNINTNSYDLNGNIQGILRNGLVYPTNAAGNIDKLLYSYQGNQLVGVDDMVTTSNIGDFTDNGHYFLLSHIPEYTYDANGNLTSDVNKGILNITYNYLNLPVSITKTDGKRVEYRYDAAGNKRCQLYYVNNAADKTTDFFTNFVYENSVPAWVAYDEGRVALNSNGTAAINEAYLKDHLGNIRVVFQLTNGSLKTRQADSYYPFGMNIKGLTGNCIDINRPNEYLYNSKMMQDEMGLGWLDYGARFYDGVLGRWHSVDPLAEKYRRWSPYNYCVNNPMRFIDPDGMRVGPGDLFKKIDDAAKDFGKCYNDNSIKGKTEYNTTIYQVVKTDPKTMKTEGYFTYSVPTKGDNASAVRSPSPTGSLDVATAHTHGAEEAGYVNNEFSPKDKENSEYRNLDIYVATPNGSLQKYDYYSKSTTTVATDMPSDPASGSERLNNIDPNTIPKNELDQSTLKTNIDTIVKTLSEVFNIFD